MAFSLKFLFLSFIFLKYKIHLVVNNFWIAFTFVFLLWCTQLFMYSCSSLSCFLSVRFCRPDDGHQWQRRHLVPDLRGGEAAGFYRRHWRHLLAHPHDFQRVAVPSSQEEEWPQQHIHWHPEGCVPVFFHCFSSRNNLQRLGILNYIAIWSACIG